MSPLPALVTNSAFVRRFTATISRLGRMSPYKRSVAAGDRARDARDWGAATDHYRRALELRPSALGIAVQLGHALKENGRYGEAEACYRSYLAENPADPDIYLQLGHLFNRQGQSENAKQWYEQAIARAPADSAIAVDAQRGVEDCGNAPSAAIRLRALQLTDRGRFDDAHALLVELVDRQGHEELTGILGNVCKETGRFAAATDYYRRYAAFARKRRPNLVVDAEVQQGHFAKARRQYNRALQHFAHAKAMATSGSETDVQPGELESEIRICLAQITKAIELR